MKLKRAWLPSALAILLSLPLPGAELLDRGLAAFPQGDGEVYLSWRLLESDRPDATFEVWRSADPAGGGERVAVIKDACNWRERSAGDRVWHYRVAVAGAPKAITRTVQVNAAEPARNYISLKLQGNYRAQKVGLADFDVDGQLDYLVKQPDFNTDPYQQPGYWKKSEDTYKLEAYRHDGAFLWRYDMGWAIEEGIWYSPIVAYDLDGDGKAEMYCKAGEGDPREPTGHVKSGPEYLVKIDGLTGKVVKRVPWPNREGFDDYNYYSRNLLGIAYLDGRHPSLIVIRGTYKIIKVQALDAELNQIWYWEASGEYAKYRGQGMHGMHAADVDEDGRDEIVLGSAVLDENGKPLWNIAKGHPDACYVADIDPARPGLEIFYGIEPGRQSNTVCLVEAKTGRQIWGSPEVTVHVHDQGMVGDIIPEEPGMECYAGEAKGGSNYWLYAASGKLLNHENMGELSPKAIYWLEGPTKVLVLRGKSGGRLVRYNGPQVGEFQGTIVGVADCLGDWREELITSLNGEIRIYSTTVPTTFRRTCLMQDRLYRNDVAAQTMGYFYPPQLGRPLALSR